jgi:hypothetical protein
LNQCLGIKRGSPGQQFVKQHAQAVDVGSSIDVQAGQARLLRTHVGGRSQKLLERGKNRLVRQGLVGRGLGNSKINHLRHRHPVVVGHQNVGRLEVAMDDALLVRMLHCVANQDEELESLPGGALVLIAKGGNGQSTHQFHDKVRPARGGRACIQDTGDIGMVHHRQRLTFGLEPCDDLPGVHAQFNHLEGHAPADGFLLFCQVNHAAAAFADFLKEFVTTDAVAGTFAEFSNDRIGFIGPHDSGGGALEEISCFGRGAQQALDPPMEFGVSSTSLGEIGGAVRGIRPLEGLGKYRLFRGRGFHWDCSMGSNPGILAWKRATPNPAALRLPIHAPFNAKRAHLAKRKCSEHFRWILAHVGLTDGLRIPNRTAWIWESLK